MEAQITEEKDDKFNFIKMYVFWFLKITTKKIQRSATVEEKIPPMPHEYTILFD